MKNFVEKHSKKKRLDQPNSIDIEWLKDDSTAALSYGNSFYFKLLPIYGIVMELSVGLMAQLVEHCT